MGAMTGGMPVAYLVMPVAVGGLAGTALSVGDAIRDLGLPGTDRPRDRHRVESAAALPQNRHERLGLTHADIGI